MQMPTGDELYDAFKVLQLTYADGAVLFGVNPATIYLWLYRGNNPLPTNRNAGPIVQAIVELGKNAENAKKLGRLLKMLIAEKGVNAARKKVMALAELAHDPA